MTDDPLHELFETETEYVNVLVVDDEEAIREFMQFRLSEEFSVDTVPTGTACLEYVRDEERPLPDVITLDLMLPDRDGYEVLEEINRYPRSHEIEVIVISGLGQGDTTTKAFDLGAADYVTKPVSTEELVRRIDRLVA